MKRAVVIGASIAGSLAARVLSHYADEVVIIERDVTSVTAPKLARPCHRAITGPLS